MISFPDLGGGAKYIHFIAFAFAFDFAFAFVFSSSNVFEPVVCSLVRSLIWLLQGLRVEYSAEISCWNQHGGKTSLACSFPSSI